MYNIIDNTNILVTNYTHILSYFSVFSFFRLKFWTDKFLGCDLVAENDAFFASSSSDLGILNILGYK